MEASEILRYNGQFVELVLVGDQRVRAHLVEVDPRYIGSEVVLELYPANVSIRLAPAGPFQACAASDIVEVIPTDGVAYLPSIATRWHR